jgi:hypothetical protein
MIGEQVVQSTGKRLVRRVLSINPPTAEVSFEDTGTILGVAANGMGTYTSVVHPDGSIHGDGQGLIMTPDGDSITWTGTGVGKFGPGGSVSYRGMIFYKTASQKLSRMNNLCGAFEFETDPAGITSSKVWEWK